MSAPRIAMLGMMLESNAFAPIATEQDFRSRAYLSGEALWSEINKPVSRLPQEVTGFVNAMNATGTWTPVPIVLTECEPTGPVDQAFFEQTLSEILTRLHDAGHIDAVYVANHGAMTATESTDPDGTMLARLRDALGPQVPIAVTLDLHANISETMVDAADIIIGYQTNPHVDMRERGEEAAFSVRLMLAGTRTHCVLMRLPLTPASVTLLTAEGPYADLIDLAQRRKREYAGAILNASVFGGFVFGDTPENGLAVVVTSREQRQPAVALAEEIAAVGWQNREAFKKSLTSLEDAVQVAIDTATDASRKPMIFSDAGDNPGGGGRGNTLWLLNALVDAGVQGVLIGSLFDPALAARAHEQGVGAEFAADFNEAQASEYSEQARHNVRVVALGDGEVVGRRGIYADRALSLGLTCLLEVGTSALRVVVISERLQTADPVFFEQFDLDVSEARTVCVKSRGHFRAGFDEWFGPDQVLEVDTAGLTSPVLSRFEWKGLPRPVYPLDENTVWPRG